MSRFSSELDATELAARIRSGDTTVIRAMESSIEAIGEKRDLGAVAFHDEELGRSQANALQVEPASAGAAVRCFHGVPFLMKDLGATAAGLPTGAGSKSLAKRFGKAQADSLLTKRFRAAGLLPFGTTTVSEFGMALSSEPAVGPIARNPADLNRTPGGSSGGAAAAVAAGIVAIAHATDAAGSTRVPAACCGLVGLKTTRGAVPEGPDFSNHLGGLVSEFVVSRSLRDAAAALRLVTGDAEGPGPDPVIQGRSVDLATPVTPLRIGVVEDGGDGPKVDADRTAGIRHAAKILAEAGHQTVSMDPSLLVQLAEQSQAVVIDLVCANLARGLSQLQPVVSPDEIEPLCFATYERGRAMSAVRLCESELSKARIAHRLWRLFEDFDVILLPMLATPPPRIGHFPLDHADIDGHWQRMSEFAPFAMLANVGGIPALSVPHGIDGAGLSIPVQLIGPMGADMLLLRVARVLEQALPWKFAFPVAGLHSL